MRPACHQADFRQRLARRSSRIDHFKFACGPVSGVASDWGGDLAGAKQVRSKFKKTRARSAGQFVKRTRSSAA